MQKFLRALRETGHVTVSTEPPSALDEDVAAALREHDTAFREELIPGAPELDVEAAHWGARMLYQACQLVIMRDVPSSVSRAVLVEPYEGKRSAAQHYSVDLTLLYLPSLYRLAERVAPEDPLLEDLRALGAQWPLSSVGIPHVDVPQELELLTNDCLCSLYVDRIVESEDVSRLANAEVRAAVTRALGAYPETCPRIAEHLERGSAA